MTTYEKYRHYLNYIGVYKNASNAATGSMVDPNANVEHKNITTMTGELYKTESIGINRLLMHDKLTELFDENFADEYIRQIEHHELYKHDETSIFPYCVSITMYPFLFNGLKNIGGISERPHQI